MAPQMDEFQRSSADEHKDGSHSFAPMFHAAFRLDRKGKGTKKGRETALKQFPGLYSDKLDGPA